jgi:hypothetical protein
MKDRGPGAVIPLLGRARRRFGRDDDPDRELHSIVARYLPANGVVAVLEPADADVATRLRQAHPAATVVSVSASGSSAHAQLTAAGPFEVIVDAHGRGKRTARFQHSVFHLRPGGVMVVRGRDAVLTDLISTALATRGQPSPGRGRGVPTAALDAHGLGLALRSVATTRSHLVAVRADFPVLAKMREHEMTEYLGLVPGPDRVLEVIPAQPFDSACVLHENSTISRPGFADHYETIDLTLREYHGAIAAPGGLLATDRVVAPDTYRHNQYRRLRNRATDEIAPRFAVMRAPTDDIAFLEGTYVHLDNEQRGHFGHLMTEQVSRFWSWHRAKELYPDAKVLLAINKERELRDWELQVYAAGGIAADDIEFVRGPVRVEHVVSGTPMLSNPDYVHPAIVPIWQSLGDNLVSASGTGRDLPRRFFASRRLDKRSCHNAPEVEDVFARRGFAVLYPEELTLGDQVRLFRDAEVIAGFVGSGLFSMCFAHRPTRVITIGSTAYSARNEYLFAALLGHRIDSVTCVPDDETTYQSPYTFDHAAEGRFLASVLDSLPSPALGGA